jgi:hypothetical protein
MISEEAMRTQSASESPKPQNPKLLLHTQRRLKRENDMRVEHPARGYACLLPLPHVPKAIVDLVREAFTRSISSEFAFAGRRLCYR